MADLGPPQLAREPPAELGLDSPDLRPLSLEPRGLELNDAPEFGVDPLVTPNHSPSGRDRSSTVDSASGGPPNPSPRQRSAWTRPLEALAERSRAQAEAYSHMFEDMAARAKWWSDTLNIASGVFGTATGAVGIATLTGNGGSGGGALNMVAGFLIALIAALIGAWRPGETQRASTLAQVRFAGIAHELELQLALEPKLRVDAQRFIEMKLRELEQLKSSAPIAPLGAAARRLRSVHVSPASQ